MLLLPMRGFGCGVADIAMHRRVSVFPRVREGFKRSFARILKILWRRHHGRKPRTIRAEPECVDAGECRRLLTRAYRGRVEDASRTRQCTRRRGGHEPKARPPLPIGGASRSPPSGGGASCSALRNSRKARERYMAAGFPKSWTKRRSRE